jgi:hypothetical protein
VIYASKKQANPSTFFHLPGMHIHRANFLPQSLFSTGKQALVERHHPFPQQFFPLASLGLAL